MPARLLTLAIDGGRKDVILLGFHKLQMSRQLPVALPRAASPCITALIPQDPTGRRNHVMLRALPNCMSLVR